MVTAEPKPPKPLKTSGLLVASTAARIRSTARSPAATSTPAAVYAGRVSATARDERILLEQELSRRDVVRDRLRIAPVEAGEAEPVVRQVQRGEDAADRQVAERVGADEVPDLVDSVGRCDQLRLDLGVDPVEARVVDRRGADPDVDLLGAGAAEQRDDLLGGRAPDDRVVDDRQALPADDLAERVQLHGHAAVAHRLAGL